jgi:serine/threonine protein kinase/tetratricopeptide (TPR) repeat protein
MVPWHDVQVNQVAEVPPMLGGRFSLLRRLGEGGFGVVYEARDARFGDRVALKLLRHDHAKAIYRFKREFRSLADRVHPNLVRLYELAADADVLYFTMELVDGVDLMSYLSGSPALADRTITMELGAGAAAPPSRPAASDRAKLSAVFAQLASGVQALHDAHKLHCDIKPSNVLVARDGRVVLLDFGLVADLDGRDENYRGAMGTPGYCAPEQALGHQLTRAADWYSVGAVLHEALTGRLPMPGTQCPVDDTALAGLAALCGELLAREPEHRPSGSDVIRRLGGTPVVTRGTSSRLVGRERELAALRGAWAVCCEGSPVLVRIVGASGLGKTALVEHFLDEVGQDALILRGRCYEQESVPYKAFDSVIDALAAYLHRLGAQAAELLPPSSPLLARLFPVLRDTLRDSGEADDSDSQEQRRRAFLALRELLRRVAARRPVVCFLDDLQWGDVDSARLLLEILRPPDAPRILVIGSHWQGPSAGFLDVFDQEALAIDDRRIALGELSETASCELAHDLVGSTAKLADAISREASGNPLFIQQLAARASEHREPVPAVGLAELLLARVHGLDAAARRLVETVVLAGQPIDEAVALRAAAFDGAPARPATLSVRHARLITARVADGATMLEPAHDRIRETVARAIDPSDARLGHRRIAEALLELARPDPDTLVWHFQCAGDDARTREYALLAADRADRALAFDRAAAYCKLILDLTPDTAAERWQLLERHGGALANAGRAAEAAESYEAAANALEASGRDDLELVNRRRAGELTLRSGRIALGTQRMERVLRTVGIQLPRSRSAAVMLAITRRLRFFVRGWKPRLQARVSPASLARLDALFSVATSVAMANHVLADALSLQHLIESLDAGERSHIIRAIGQEATFEAVIGGGWLQRRCADMLATMEALVIEDNDPYHHAWMRMARGIAGWFRGDWETTWRELDDAITLYREHCHGVAWELALCDAYRLPGLAYLGELGKLSEIVPRAYASARDSGDLFAANTLRLGQQSLVRLAEHRPEDAIAEADAAIAPFPRDVYLGPHYHHLFAVVQAELYRGRPAEAWSAVDTAWRDIERARFLAAQCLRVEIRHLRARTALALAAARPDRARQLHAIALADAARIARDDVAPAAPFAALIRAGVAYARGDRDRARVQLESAVNGFDRARMRLYAHAARDRLGAMVAGTTGAELRDGATTWAIAQNICRPDAMIAMLAPGI